MAAWYGILLALSLGLKHNGSVRVDVFSQRWSERKQALVGIGGIIIFYCRFVFSGAGSALIMSRKVGRNTKAPIPADYPAGF